MEARSGCKTENRFQGVIAYFILLSKSKGLRLTQWIYAYELKWKDSNECKDLRTCTPVCVCVCGHRNRQCIGWSVSVSDHGTIIEFKQFYI